MTGLLLSVRSIAAVELRLLVRDWSVMTFAIGFPVLLMLILGGVFGTEASSEYDGVTPAAYYTADYVAVPLGALTLIGLPVALATYRERGVLRRFAAAGVPMLRVVAAQAIVVVLLAVVAAAVVLLAAWPVYGVPAVQDALPILPVALLGSMTMIVLGTALGLVAKTARAAQALGLLAFFPMWLLGAGGPPRPVMPDAMGAIADWLPLGRVAEGIRNPWLGVGDIGANLAVLGGWTVVAGAAVLVLSRRGVTS